MFVRVLIFGPLAALAGADHVMVDVASEATVRVVRQAMTAQYPALASVIAAGRFAVNNSFADEQRPVQTGDEIALIALVSGG